MKHVLRPNSRFLNAFKVFEARKNLERVGSRSKPMIKKKKTFIQQKNTKFVALCEMRKCFLTRTFLIIQVIILDFILNL